MNCFIVKMLKMVKLLNDSKTKKNKFVWYV